MVGLRTWYSAFHELNEIHEHMGRVSLAQGFHGNQLPMTSMRYMNTWEGLVWHRVSHGWLALLLLGLCPGSTLCAEYNQVSLHG